MKLNSQERGSLSGWDISLGFIILFAIIGVISIGYVTVNELGVATEGHDRLAVSRKNYTPAHLQTTTHVIGNVVIPISNYIPAEYYLCFQMKNSESCGTVTESVWIDTNVGDRFLVSYGYGRIDRSYVINNLAKE